MSTDSRVLLPDETRLVRTLIAVAGLDLPSNWVDEVLVADLADGGMGNVRFLPVKIGQRMGIEAAEVRFRDADGVEVSATLNLDEDGAPFEIDIWKVDFSPLLRIGEILSPVE